VRKLICGEWAQSYTTHSLGRSPSPR